MVITAKEEARKEHDILQKRNDQLRAQLADTEGLLKFQQEQLAELKQVMEHMGEERDDQTNPTAPSTPGLSKFDNKDNSTETEAAQPSSIPDTMTPTYPTSFTHLLQMTLRVDLAAYEDFTALLKMSKNIPASSRNSSGSYGSMGLGLGLGGYTPHTLPTNGSSTSLSTAGTPGSVPVTPTTPVSANSLASTTGPNSLTPLKDTKFYKRSYVEDIEPTLRLETAPGLSWLARRNVLQAVNDGAMVVEPIPTGTKTFNAPCTLCGENRKDASHTRTHRFRTNESDGAQRYPLCRYCLGRVRSTCDFLGFLRILKDGHWRADDAESEKAAWEESVRLREQMFWCRIGGGVVPATGHLAEVKSPRSSEDRRKDEEAKLSEEIQQTGEIQPRDVTRLSGTGVDITKRASLTRAMPPSSGDVKDVPSHDALPQSSEPAGSTNDNTDSSSIQPSSEVKDANGEHDLDVTHSLDTLKTPKVETEEPKRLSLTIPGSFN